MSVICVSAGEMELLLGFGKMVESAELSTKPDIRGPH